MKKICRTLKLMKFRSRLNEDSIKNIEGTEFTVCFDNGKYIRVYDTDDLRRLLERDHINPIRYIFDMTDRIMISRDVFDTDEV